MKTEKR